MELTLGLIKEVFNACNASWEGDNAFKGLKILSKYTGDLICGAEHDQIWGPDIQKCIEKGLTLEDVIALGNLNWMVDEDSFSCFV